MDKTPKFNGNVDIIQILYQSKAKLPTVFASFEVNRVALGHEYLDTKPIKTDFCS